MEEQSKQVSDQMFDILGDLGKDAFIHAQACEMFNVSLHHVFTAIAGIAAIMCEPSSVATRTALRGLLVKLMDSADNSNVETEKAFPL